MIDADEYCIDVLTQLSAAHGDDERDAKLTEAVRAVGRLVRS